MHLASHLDHEVERLPDADCVHKLRQRRRVRLQGVIEILWRWNGCAAVAYPVRCYAFMTGTAEYPKKRPATRCLPSVRP